MSKVTISTTQKTTITTEIPVPCFLRSLDEKEYIALLDEKTIVSVFKTDQLTIIKNSSIESSISKQELTDAWQKFHGCTEVEFLQAYDAVIESISLHPKLAV
ncbi:MAG TPA: hypothetical protein VF487_20200 [Chitinophagaceae bacterium]